MHLNLAYRWFCRLGLNDVIPDRTTSSSTRLWHYRQSELLRHRFEATVARSVVDEQRKAVDASVIGADANNQYASPNHEWDRARIDADAALRAVREYSNASDDEAFGATSTVEPKFTSFSDPEGQWTAAPDGPAFFSYSDNHLIDTDQGVIVDL
ncbi:hypothetical protein KX928_06730 [Roseobacter sp. YSTF-M11]|uniref:Transposase InsH N-terminal domain-containing protein n=1 Tax=Roseobacter insulae TaxID=2859783 RepID=A0A9X1FTP3_9RHOB|nr:hypothetical protein [Roseobacter insulae]